MDPNNVQIVEITGSSQPPAGDCGCAEAVLGELGTGCLDGKPGSPLAPRCL